MTQKQYEELYNWVYEEIHHNRDSYSRSKIIEMIMDKAEKLVNKTNDIHDVIQSDYLCDRECSGENKCDEQCYMCADMEKHSV